MCFYRPCVKTAVYCSSSSSRLSASVVARKHNSRISLSLFLSYSVVPLSSPVHDNKKDFSSEARPFIIITLPTRSSAALPDSRNYIIAIIIVVIHYPSSRFRVLFVFPTSRVRRICTRVCVLIIKSPF